MQLWIAVAGSLAVGVSAKLSCCWTAGAFSFAGWPTSAPGDARGGSGRQCFTSPGAGAPPSLLVVFNMTT